MPQADELLKQIGVKTFCQIVGKDITAPMCMEMQGQEGCFGCAARTRLCEMCHQRIVDVPAVGMCSRCLTNQFEHEVPANHGKIELLRVDCQLLKRQISGKMCLATQGQEGCRDCPAPTRLCENCKRKPVRFKQYGLCLACSVEEYGGGWKPGVVDTSREVSDVVREQAQGSPDDTGTREGYSRVMNVGGKDYRVTVRVAAPKGGAPVSVEAPITIVSPDDEFGKLVAQAKALIFECRRASRAFLHKELGIDFRTAGEILVQLESDGVVGPYRPKTSRQILIGPEDPPKDLSPNGISAGQAPLCKECDKPIWFKQIGMCRSHGTQHYGNLKTRKKVRKNRQLPPEEELKKLCVRAKNAILRHNRASNSFLMKELGHKFYTVQEVLRRLEKEGLIGPPMRGPVPREILVPAEAEKVALGSVVSRKGEKAATREKMRVLGQLAKFFGQGSVTSEVIRSIIEDLDEFRHLKETLRQLGKK